AQNTFLQSLTREKVEQLFQGQQLQAYERTTQACVHVLAADLVAQLRQGEARYHVVDHPVNNSPLATTFDVPLFLRQNWFLNSGSNADGYEKSLICSAAGSFTPIHVDAYGMQGWMYLLYGKKQWELYHPRDIPLLFDDVFKEF